MPRRKRVVPEDESLLFPGLALPPLPPHLRHLTAADFEESRRAQDASLPGAPLQPSRPPSIREVFRPWRARAREIILRGLQDRHALGLVSAICEAEFCCRVEESPRVRQMVRWLGWNAHFIIAGLWWLSKEMASPKALLAARGERGLSSKQRVQRHRQRLGDGPEQPAIPPGTFPLIFAPRDEKRKAGRPTAFRDPALWAARVFQTLAVDHIARATKGQRTRRSGFRNWAAIGALTAEFSAWPFGSQDREATRRSVRQLRGALASDVESIKGRLRLVLMDALQGKYLYGPRVPGRIPWKRLRREWSEMIHFQMMDRSAKPIIVLLPNTPLEPGQSIAEWMVAQRKAGRISVLNPPSPPLIFQAVKALL
jgi:hypothetical protein